jgi:hypothetical protein
VAGVGRISADPRAVVVVLSVNHLPATLLTDPDAPGHLYAGLTNGDIWFSASYGDDWRKLPVNLRGIWHQLLML